MAQEAGLTLEDIRSLPEPRGSQAIHHLGASPGPSTKDPDREPAGVCLSFQVRSTNPRRQSTSYHFLPLHPIHPIHHSSSHHSTVSPTSGHPALQAREVLALRDSASLAVTAETIDDAVQHSAIESTMRAYAAIARADRCAGIGWARPHAKLVLAGLAAEHGVGAGQFPETSPALGPALCAAGSVSGH